MAAEPEITKIEELIQRSEAARQSLSGHFSELRRRTDVAARVKNSFRAHPSAWFGGSLVLGWIFSTLVKRKSVKTKDLPRHRKGMLAFALSAGVALAKPALKTLLISEIRKRMMPAVNKMPPTGRS